MNTRTSQLCFVVFLLSTLAMVAPVQASPELTAPPVVVSSSGSNQVLPAASDLDNMILNGDFEITSLPPGCHFNLNNDDATESISNMMFWGPADEIDFLNDGTGCGYLSPPQSGVSSLALHRQEFGNQDAFCFELASPVVEGVTYSVSFHLMANTEFSPELGSVEVGLSNDATTFGTLVFSGSGNDTDWTYVEHSFAAPMTANYLCVQAGPDWAWNNTDNFTLGLAVVPVSATRWESLKSYYR